MSRSSKSYSQRKREKMDYRREYFKHNPGLFGCIWTCAYCHKAIVGRENVNVDHIIPLNNVLGRNARFNLVAACERCNKKKSDKVDGRIVEGYISKIFEVIVFSIQKVVIVACISVYFCIRKVIEILLKLLVAPFKGTSLTVKGIAIIVYAVIIFVIYYRFWG